MSSPTAAEGPTSAGAPTDPPPPPATPTFEGGDLGRYQLGRLLGEGGFGDVYLAEQLEPVQRQVAIKLLKAGLDSAQVLARFEAEHQALAIMDHPGIATVYDAGVSENGRPYFVMEYVDGESLPAYCDRRQLDVRARLALFERVCLAVQHAHQKGVIHRDLKPSNILITEVDGKPQPKVIDFGIAKAIGPKLTNRTLVTDARQLIGTPEFMSPEQAAMGGDIDTRTDVYSLGVLLYELLCGAPPFDRERLRKAGFRELEEMICEEEPPRPSVRLLGLGEGAVGVSARRSVDQLRLQRQLRAELDWVVMRAMEKDRNRRYSTAEALALDIRRYLRDETVMATPPSRAYRFRKFARRRRLELGATVIVVLALLSTVVFSVTFALQKSEAERQANAALEEKALELSKYQAISDFTRRLISGVDPAVAAREDTTLMRSILSDAESEIDRNPPAAAVVEIELRTMLGTSLLAIADFDAAEKQLTRALQRADEDPEIAPALGVVRTARSTLSKLYWEQDRYAEAEEIMRESMRIELAELGDLHPDTWATMGNLAAAYSMRGDFAGARDLFDRVLRLQREHLGDDDEQTIATMNNLAGVCTRLGETDRAVKLYEYALQHHLETKSPEHPRVLTTLNNLANAYRTIDRAEDAVRLLEQVVETKRAIYEPAHPSLIRSCVNLAGAYEDAGRDADSEALYVESIEVARTSLPETDLRTAALLNNYAIFLGKRDRIVDALPIMEDAVRRMNLILPDTNVSRIMSNVSLVSMYHEVEQYEQAEILARSIRPVGEQTLTEDDPRRPVFALRLGKALVANEKYDEAEPLLLAAHEQYLDLRGEDDDRTRETVEALMTLYEAIGRADDVDVWRSRLSPVADAGS